MPGLSSSAEQNGTLGRLTAWAAVAGLAALAALLGAVIYAMVQPPIYLMSVELEQAVAPQVTVAEIASTDQTEIRNLLTRLTAPDLDRGLTALKANGELESAPEYGCRMRKFLNQEKELFGLIDQRQKLKGRLLLTGMQLVQRLDNQRRQSITERIKQRTAQEKP